MRTSIHDAVRAACAARVFKEAAMRDHPIVITESDAAKLRGLLATRARAERDRHHLEELLTELERAVIVEPHEVPHDVITMQTRVRVRDLMSGERRDLMLVLPTEADVRAQRISVLAPLGTALLGYREGDEVEWVMPGGLRHMRVERVLQPTESGPARAREAEFATVG
jgi:regulator of nucleoside diphosphate kinase